MSQTHKVTLYLGYRYLIALFPAIKDKIGICLKSFTSKLIPAFGISFSDLDESGRHVIEMDLEEVADRFERAVRSALSDPDAAWAVALLDVSADCNNVYVKLDKYPIITVHGASPFSAPTAEEMARRANILKRLCNTIKRSRTEALRKVGLSHLAGSS